MKHRSFTEELARSRGDACRGEETLGIFVQARESSPVSASTCAEQASNVYGSFVYNTPICLRAGEQAPPPPSSEGAATWPSPAHQAARVPIRPDLSGQGGSKIFASSPAAATVTRPGSIRPLVVWYSLLEEHNLSSVLHNFLPAL